MFTVKQQFIDNIDNLVLEGYRWEMLNYTHTEYILEWRNDPRNLILFENQDKLTKDKQYKFLDNYTIYDRIDIVLTLCKKPIGVFNIKNLETAPEYGALIGEEGLRGKGIGFSAKNAIFNYWFNVLDQESIFVKNKKVNKKVIQSNLKIGFELYEEDEQFIILKLDQSVFNKTK